MFENEGDTMIVTEYIPGGDLFQKVKNEGRISESDAKIYFRQIVYGLAQIHCRNILHRDIKLDNILIDNNYVVKICDFGVSKIMHKGVIINDQCGTPAYIAPEIITEEVA